jgi:hypothetical protein
MRTEPLLRDGNAVAGVIEALLIVALIAIVISIIQLVYIPQVMEQREAQHMDDVENQFSYLKSMIDIQAITSSDAPMYSMITLGSRELPYFVTARSFGELKIIGGDSGNNLAVYPNMTGPSSKGTFNLTAIKYKASNAYFVDQTYILEGGGVIRDQPTGTSSMIVYPSISAKKKSDSGINLSFSLPEITGKKDKTDRYGHENCFIRTDYASNSTYSGNISSLNGGYIRIYTDYPHAWNKSLYDILWKFIDEGYANVSLSQSPSYVEITPEENKYINFKLVIQYIEAQIGPGIVKS